MGIQNRLQIDDKYLKALFKEDFDNILKFLIENKLIYVSPKALPVSLAV